MKILIATHAFYPSVGGIETASESLARQLSQMGHHVTVVTRTMSAERHPSAQFTIVRRPSLPRLLQLAYSHDCMLQYNVSLRTLWAPVLVMRPVAVCLATWIQRANGKTGVRDRVKRLLLSRCTVVAVSEAVGKSFGSNVRTINNSYRADVFFVREDVATSRDLAFVGRLVSDKGADVLMQALALMRSEFGLYPTLDVFGQGPELVNLARMVKEEGLEEQVRFRGLIVGNELAVELNRVKVLVVPSTWQEPFGIVALEGLACGCAVVASDAGGLPEAVSAFGTTVPPGDAHELAKAIRSNLKPSYRKESRQGVEAHLSAHTPEFEARQFEDVLMTMLNRLRS